MLDDLSENVLGASGLPAGETDRFRQLIEQWTSDLVEGHIQEWEAYWAEDAMLMPAGAGRIVGRSDISAYVRENYGSVKSYRFSEWSYAGRDDLAVVANHIELDIQSTGSASTPAFNQMIVLRRDADQRWHIQAVILTPSRP